MPIPEPRIFLSSSGGSVSRSRPSKSARPDTRAPRVRPRIVCVETLFPDPASPTIASVRPRSTPNDTPRTASTSPSGVGKETVRSCTSSSRLTGGSRARSVGPVEPDRGVGAVEALVVERAVLDARRVVDRLLALGQRHEPGVVHDLRGGVLPGRERLLLGERGQRAV